MPGQQCFFLSSLFSVLSSFLTCLFLSLYLCVMLKVNLDIILQVFREDELSSFERTCFTGPILPVQDKILLSSKAAYSASGQEVQAGLFLTEEDRTPATSRLEVWSLIFVKAIYGPKINYHYVYLFKHF